MNESVSADGVLEFLHVCFRDFLKGITLEGFKFFPFYKVMGLLKFDRQFHLYNPFQVSLICFFPLFWMGFSS